MREANFSVLGTDKITGALVIRDDGGVCPSVTNDAENVIQKLLRSEALKYGQRLFYYDSENNLDEIVVSPLGKLQRFYPYRKKINLQ